MHECQCLSCKNFKNVIDENGTVSEYEFECEYDFPSEACLACQVEECELLCEHYESEQEEIESSYVIAHCATCGIELKVSADNDEEGYVYCVACYLKKK